MRTVDEVVAEVRALAVADRLRVVEKVVHEIAVEAAAGRGSGGGSVKINPIGWLAGQPEVEDELEEAVRELRAAGRPRGWDCEDGD